MGPQPRYSSRLVVPPALGKTQQKELKEAVQEKVSVFLTELVSRMEEVK